MRPIALAGTVGVADVGGRFAYDDGSPREVLLPRDSPGGTRQRSASGALQNGAHAWSSASLPFRAPTKQGCKRLEQACPRRRSEQNSEGNSFRNAEEGYQNQNPPSGSSLMIGNGSLLLIGPTGSEKIGNRMIGVIPGPARRRRTRHNSTAMLTRAPWGVDRGPASWDWGSTDSPRSTPHGLRTWRPRSLPSVRMAGLEAHRHEAKRATWKVAALRR